MQFPAREIPKEKAIPKIRHYCAYQERTHQEVKEKLYGFGLRKTDVEEILGNLIADDYLNEERFACQFAGGRFRMKKWGKIKITHELKQRQVSAYNIKTALASIPEEDYIATLTRLAEEKWETLERETNLTRLVKTMNYLVQKGYEYPLAKAVVDACGKGMESN